MHELENLYYKYNVKDGENIVLLSQNGVSLYANNRGWTVGYEVRYLRNSLFEYSRYDYEDAIGSALILFEKTLLAVKALDTLSLEFLKKIQDTQDEAR